MRVNIKAKTGARMKKIEKTGENEFIVAVRERPIENKANIAIMDTLADYFKVSKSQVRLISGQNSKRKIFEILD